MGQDEFTSAMSRMLSRALDDDEGGFFCASDASRARSSNALDCALLTYVRRPSRYVGVRVDRA